MVELITKILSLALLIFQWVRGNKAEKAKRAKEIAEKFKKITRDGDNLFDEVWSELNRRSDSNWDDIPVRNNNHNEGDSDG